MKCKDKSVDNTCEREGKNHDEYKPQTFQFFVIIYCIRIQLSSLVSTGPQSPDCYKIVQYIDRSSCSVWLHGTPLVCCQSPVLCRQKVQNPPECSSRRLPVARNSHDILSHLFKAVDSSYNVTTITTSIYKVLHPLTRTPK